MEETKLKELATRSLIGRLETKIETTKVETIQWVIATGIVVLGSVAVFYR
ncbi:MAG: CCDC90 family protein [Magnetococcus sp. YQC-9]